MAAYPTEDPPAYLIYPYLPMLKKNCCKLLALHEGMKCFSQGFLGLLAFYFVLKNKTYSTFLFCLGQDQETIYFIYCFDAHVASILNYNSSMFQPTQSRESNSARKQHMNNDN